MRHLKKFSDFEEEGIIRKVSINSERAQSFILESERKQRTLSLNLEKVGINADNASDYVEHCYDIILFLIRAKMLSAGYSATGQGAHEAEVSYLRKVGFPEKDVLFINQIRYFRNGILYYGTLIDQEYAQKVIEFTKKVVIRL